MSSFDIIVCLYIIIMVEDYYSSLAYEHLVLDNELSMSKSVLTYFKAGGNHNEEQQVKLPNPTGQRNFLLQLFQWQKGIFEEREFNKNERTIC